MKTITTLLVLISLVSVALGQIRFDSAIPVSKDDPIVPILANYKVKTEAACEQNGLILLAFSPWVQVQSPAAIRLFPKLRFASASCLEQCRPSTKVYLNGIAFSFETTKGPPHGITSSFETTLAINTESRIVEAELHDSGNFEEFGKMLVNHAVRLGDESDAKTVWDAFCEIHHFHWEDHPAKRISSSEWHLGLSSYDQTVAEEVDGFKTEVTLTHYMKVVINPETCRIISWECFIDSSSERKVPAK